MADTTERAVTRREFLVRSAAVAGGAFLSIGVPPGLRGGAAVAALDLEGFAVSSGPACSSGVERRNTVVEAMGFGEEAAERTLRVSLGPGTSVEEVFGLAAAIERIWCRGKGGVR